MNASLQQPLRYYPGHARTQSVSRKTFLPKEIVVKRPTIKVTKQFKRRFSSSKSSMSAAEGTFPAESEVKPSVIASEKTLLEDYTRLGNEAKYEKLLYKHKANTLRQQRILDSFRSKTRKTLKKIEDDVNKTFNLVNSEMNYCDSVIKETKYGERWKVRMQSIHQAWTKKLWGHINKRFLDLAQPKQRLIKYEAINKRSDLNKSVL